MTSKLHSSRVWDRITALARKQPTKCSVAVAYFGSGASKLLPLKKRSVLVVDISEHAVRSGQTKPSEVPKLMNSGVEAHTLDNFHAKVFVMGPDALMGSANASNSSANRLIEAVIDLDDQRLVRACRDFVEYLKGELVTSVYAKRMQRLYKPPNFGVAHRGRRKRRDRSVPQRSVTLVVPLEGIALSNRASECAEAGRPTAHQKMRLGSISN